MSAGARFNALIAMVTVAIMFGAIKGLGPLLPVAWFGTSYLASVLVTWGVYRILVVALQGAMAQWLFVKRWVLGGSFVHGTWVGVFVGRAGDVRYLAEHFVQDMDSLVISGQSFTLEGAAHGFWISEMASVDERRGCLTFTYTFDIVTRDKPLHGMHWSQLQRASRKDAPTALAGFAHDLNDRRRVVVQSTKVSDSLLSWNDALDRAKQLSKERPELTFVPKVASRERHRPSSSP